MGAGEGEGEHMSLFAVRKSFFILTGFRKGRSICLRVTWKKFAGVEQFTTIQLQSYSWRTSKSSSFCRKIMTRVQKGSRIACITHARGRRTLKTKQLWNTISGSREGGSP